MNTPNPNLSLAIAGSGGSGVVVISQLLQHALARSGLSVLLQRSAGPQIRGGESLAMLRIAPQPVHCPADTYDMLVALDWHNFERFAAEVPVHAHTQVLMDAAAGPMPAALPGSLPSALSVAFAETAKATTGGRANMVCLGYLAHALGIERQVIDEVASSRLESRGQAVMDAVRACVEAGWALAHTTPLEAPALAPDGAPRWLLSGNEATGFGLLAGGARFAAAYPITPASDLLEWMAPRLVARNGNLVQAEDELASINMTIGASFAGTPSITATSGPGLALMTEGLGLAVASETPVTVVNVTRGGPSTGIPTKSEQSDLDIALHGLHGDAPHVVTAALTIADCAFTGAWTVDVAEQLQTAAIMLTDQSLAQSSNVVDPVEMPATSGRRLATAAEPYLRYDDTDDGVSPMSVPGMAGCAYVADGLEHDAAGVPSSMAEHHQRGLDKRLRKLLRFDPGDAWGERSGAGELALLTFGSSYGAVCEAAERLRAAGVDTRVVAPRLLSPLPVARMEQALAGATRVVVVECNHSGQFHRHLRAHLNPAIALESLTFPGPLPLRPGALVSLLSKEPAE